MEGHEKFRRLRLFLLENRRRIVALRKPGTSNYSLRSQRALRPRLSLFPRQDGGKYGDQAGLIGPGAWQAGGKKLTAS